MHPRLLFWKFVLYVFFLNVKLNYSRISSISEVLRLFRSTHKINPNLIFYQILQKKKKKNPLSNNVYSEFLQRLLNFTLFFNKSFHFSKTASFLTTNFCLMPYPFKSYILNFCMLQTFDNK